MSDKRTNERINLLDFQPVLDVDSGKVVGYLGDVSVEGLKLLSKKPIASDTLRLRLQYITFGGRAESPELETDRIWERRDDGQAFVETGLRFREPAPDTIASIERIVADLRDRDAR